MQTVMAVHAPAPLVVALLTGLILAKLIARYFRNPLRKVPAAHPLAHFTSLWIHSVRWRGIENATLRRAHDRLGPIVCLSPEEVSVNCVKGGIRDVYAGGFEKGNAAYNWYAFFANYGGMDNMFSTKSNRLHSARKRMLSNIYSKSFIMANEALRSQVGTIIHQRFLPSLERRFEQDKPVVLNVYPFLSATTMDIVTAYIFGIKSSSNLIDDAKQLEWFLDLYNSRRSFNFWPQEFPNLTNFLYNWLSYRLYPRWVDEANQKIEAWTWQMCQSAQQTLAESTEIRLQDKPVVYQQLQQTLTKEANSNGTIPQPHRIASELLDQLAAGFDTSGITLAYIVYELSRHPNIQSLLHDELMTLSPSLASSSSSSSPCLPDPKVIDAIPILHAVVWETLRLHSAIPGPQPRFTPSQGCTLGPEQQAYFIPGGVRVSASAGLLHMNEHVFERATEWRPERWLNMENLDKEKRRDMESRWFWAFGSGGRMCVGSHLAVYQMKYIIAAIYTNYKTTIVDDTDFEQSDAYTAPPKSDDLIIRLDRV